MDEEDCERRVGTTLSGKWTLTRLLGVGGMAAVYEATHKIGRRDAIKILHPHVARSPEQRARFEREAHAVNAFKHPGAVEIRDTDVSEDGAPFLVMELLEGTPLSVLARSEAGVPVSEVLRIVDDMLDVLAAAHAVGVVHRDVKPDNVFLLDGGRVKVLDFGIARFRAPPTAGGAPALRTRTGTALGTVSYMPPEQVKGLDIDARADLFAVGATMFRLIARRRVHEADTEVGLMMRMASEPAPPLSSVVPDVAPGLAMVVDRALAFDRERRYPDARTMQEDVRCVRRGEAPTYAAARLAAGDVPQTLPPEGSAPAASSSSGPELGVISVSPMVAAAPIARDAPTRAGPDARDAPTREDASALPPRGGTTAPLAQPYVPVAAVPVAARSGPAPFVPVAAGSGPTTSPTARTLEPEAPTASSAGDTAKRALPFVLLAGLAAAGVVALLGIGLLVWWIGARSDGPTASPAATASSAATPASPVRKHVPDPAVASAKPDPPPPGVTVVPAVPIPVPAPVLPQPAPATGKSKGKGKNLRRSVLAPRASGAYPPLPIAWATDR